MQKFVNPEGLIAHFEGGAVSELGRHDPKRHKLPVKLTLRGQTTSDDLKAIDAFNALDFFIVSADLADAIDTFTNSQWPRRRAFLFLNGQKLDRDYVVLILNRMVKVGAFKATEADWTPDASYPVVPGALGDFDMALDEELKFPVLSDQLVDALNAKGYSFSSRAYPVQMA